MKHGRSPKHYAADVLFSAGLVAAVGGFLAGNPAIAAVGVLACALGAYGAFMAS